MLSDKIGRDARLFDRNLLGDPGSEDAGERIAWAARSLAGILCSPVPDNPFLRVGLEAILSSLTVHSGITVERAIGIERSLAVLFRFTRNPMAAVLPLPLLEDPKFRDGIGQILQNQVSASVYCEEYDERCRQARLDVIYRSFDVRKLLISSAPGVLSVPETAFCLLWLEHLSSDPTGNWFFRCWDGWRWSSSETSAGTGIAEAIGDEGRQAAPNSGSPFESRTMEGIVVRAMQFSQRLETPQEAPEIWSSSPHMPHLLTSVEALLSHRLAAEARLGGILQLHDVLFGFFRVSGWMGRRHILVPFGVGQYELNRICIQLMRRILENSLTMSSDNGKLVDTIHHHMKLAIGNSENTAGWDGRIIGRLSILLLWMAHLLNDPNGVRFGELIGDMAVRIWPGETDGGKWR